MKILLAPGCPSVAYSALDRPEVFLRDVTTLCITIDARVCVVVGTPRRRILELERIARRAFATIAVGTPIETLCETCLRASRTR